MKGDIFDVEQLVRASEDSDLHWVHPVNQIVDEIDSDQVLRLRNGKRHSVQRKWNFERLNKFTLKNINDISKAFDIQSEIDHYLLLYLRF